MTIREEYVEKLKKDLDEWNTELNRLETSIRKVDAQSRARYRAVVQGIEGKIRLLKQNIALIENAGTEAWQEIKVGAENAWKDLEKSFKDARDKFNY
jgi:hypothetical protein